MATIQRQNALVWVLWFTLITLGCCRSLKDLKKVLQSQTTAGVTRQDDTIHARNSSEPSIERVLYYGHLTIGAKKLNLIDEGKPIARDTELFGEPFDDDTDYQSDSYSMVKESELGVEGVFSQGNKRTPAVDRLLGMKPKVECVEDSMTLKLHGAASSQFSFLVDRGNAHPLSLSQMPSVCGYSVRKSWRDLVFSTPYDGCFVAEEGSNYVLPLFIYGLPVRMACPSIAPKPPSASCHVSGMTVEIESSSSVKDVHVKVNSKWESLMKISSQCGFSVVEHPEGVIISAPYLPCIKEQDGMLTFEVVAGGDFKISCPSQPSTIHAIATARPESPTTALAGALKPAPVEDPQHPQRPGPPSTQAPLYPVYPQKPTPFEYPSNSMPLYTPEPVQSPEQFPFYPFPSGFDLPHPQPDPAAAIPEPEHSVEPQNPQRPGPPSTQAPLYPVYPKKPAPVEDPQHPQRPGPPSTQAPLYPVYPKKPAPVEYPSKSMPLYTPEPVQSPEQFPFYPFHPGFYLPHPQPDPAAASPKPEHSVEPQNPQRPGPPSTQAPLYPVYPKKPAPVEYPSKSMPLYTPEPVQSPEQFPFYPFHPGFYPQLDGATAIPEPEHSVEPQHPQRPGPPSTQAPLYPVYPKKPTPVEEPQHPQRPGPPSTQAPLYPVYPKKPAPVEDPQHPQRPGPPSTQAPLYPVYPQKPTPFEYPSNSMPLYTPEPVQSPEQFPFYPFHPGFYLPHPQPDPAAASPKPEHSVEPQNPQRPGPPSTQAPLYPVYPKKPAPVEYPSKSMPLYTPEPVQSPEPFPFYPFHPGFYPQLDGATAIPEPEHSVEPQHPQRPGPPSTQAPLYPVYPKKPTPVEEPQHPQRPGPPSTQAPLYPVYPQKPTPFEYPSNSMPLYTPEPVQSPEQFPFYPFPSGFDLPHPQPDRAAAIPEPEHSVEPQNPQRPGPPSTQAPLYPVYPKNPAPVEYPSKSMPLYTPEPVQSPEQFPFDPFHPGFDLPHPQPDAAAAAASPEPEHSVEPQNPQRPGPLSTQAPLYPVYPKKPAPVEDPQHPQRPGPPSTQAPLYPVYPKKPAPVEYPSKSMPLYTPEPVQSPEQFPFYPFHPGFDLPHSQPDAAASPEPEHSVEPQNPQRPGPPSTQAPLYPVYPKKPAPVEYPSKSMPLYTPEPVQSPEQFPFYPFHPGFYLPHPQPDRAAASPEPDHSVEPQHPQRPGPPSTQAPLYPVYPKKPAPVEYPSKSMPLYTPEPVQSPAPLTTQAPKDPAYPQSHYPPSSFPIEPKPPTRNTKYSGSYTPGSHPVIQSPNLVPTPIFIEPAYSQQTEIKTAPEGPAPPNRVFHQPTHCSTVCTVAYSNCCPLALSFHQHHHHHNYFGPVLGQMVQPATSGKEPSFIQQHFSHSLTNKQLLYPFLNATYKSTSPTPSLQRVSYQEQDAKRMLISKPDPTVKPISPSTNQIDPPSRSSYMYTPVNDQHFQHPPNSVQLTQQSASKSPSIQPVKDPLPHQWFQYPYNLPNPKLTSSSGPDIPTNNPESTTVKTLGLPSVQEAKYPILKPQSPVKDPAPYPSFQTPYFVPYPPPTSKPCTLPESLTSLPHPSITSAFNTEAPSSQFHKGLISTPPSSKPTQKSVPYPWSQHLPDPFRSFSSDSPRVHSTQSKPSTSELTQREPLGVSQTQYWHQTVPTKAAVGDKHSKVPFDPESSKPHPQSVGSSKKIPSPHYSSSGANDNYFVPLGSSQFKDYWKPLRLHHKQKIYWKPGSSLKYFRRQDFNLGKI